MNPLGSLVACLLASVVVIWPFPVSQGQNQDSPQDETIDRGQIVFRNNCLMCHSVELVQGQRLSRAQWEAEITKMIGWGAPVASNETTDLLVFLMDRFGADQPRIEPQTIPSTEVAARSRFLAQPSPFSGEKSLDDARAQGEALYKTHCASCHGPAMLGGEVGTKLIGQPSLLDEEGFRNLLRQGRNKMPGFANVLKPDEEKALQAWLLGLPSG